MVNVIASAAFFCLRLVTYQVESEHHAWICYVDSVSQIVEDRFGYVSDGLCAYYVWNCFNLQFVICAGYFRRHEFAPCLCCR